MPTPGVVQKTGVWFDDAHDAFQRQDEISKGMWYEFEDNFIYRWARQSYRDYTRRSQSQSPKTPYFNSGPTGHLLHLLGAGQMVYRIQGTNFVDQDRVH